MKPSHGIRVGQVVEVRKPPVTYSFEVLGLIENRVGAKLVPNYLKNVTSRDQLELLEMVKISGFVNRQKGLGRPTKKEGRELAQFTETAFFGFDDFDDDFFDEDEDERDV